jgi:hypothetical protein
MNWRVKTIGLILLLGCAAMFGQKMFGQNKTKEESSYEALVERAKNGDQTVDFRQLRIAYSEWAHMGAPGVDPQKKAMLAELKAKDYSKAIKDGDAVLASDFVDMDAHFAEYLAYSELKETEKAEFHKLMLQHLLHSITDSGDGKTPATAYQVIEVHEEYVILRFMGVGLPKSQAYLKKDGHSYDEIKFDDPQTKKEQTLYFNVDIPAKHGL